MFKPEERNSLRADRRTRCRSDVSQMRGIGLLYVDCPAHRATPDDGSYKSVPTTFRQHPGIERQEALGPAALDQAPGHRTRVRDERLPLRFPVNP